MAARTIQSEWIILQRATKDMGQAFMGLEKVMLENVLSHLFFGRLKTLPPVVGTLSTFLVNKSKMGLQNSVTSAEEKYTSFLCARYDLIGSVMS